MTESELLSGFRHMGEREKGRFGEAVFKQVFVSSGLRFIPLCDIQNGGAPMMEGADKVILPDFELIGNGFSAYVDAKCKGQSVLFRNRNQVRQFSCFLRSDSRLQTASRDSLYYPNDYLR